MIITFQEVLSGPKIFEGEESVSILELGPVDGRQVQTLGAIHYHLKAYLAADQMIVEGRIRMKVVFGCVRCADPFEIEVADNSFQGLFPVSDKIESVDLTGDIRETILLHFPPYPVCRAECKGLCAQCGANLNKKPCKCKPVTDLRWSGLDSIQIPRKKKR